MQNLSIALVYVLENYYYIPLLANKNALEEITETHGAYYYTGKPELLAMRFLSSYYLLTVVEDYCENTIFSIQEHSTKEHRISIAKPRQQSVRICNELLKRENEHPHALISQPLRFNF